MNLESAINEARTEIKDGDFSNMDKPKNIIAKQFEKFLIMDTKLNFQRKKLN